MVGGGRPTAVWGFSPAVCQKPKNPHMAGFLSSGGGGGIRTHGTEDRTLDFESSPFDHSGTPPRARHYPRGLPGLSNSPGFPEFMNGGRAGSGPEATAHSLLSRIGARGLCSAGATCQGRRTQVSVRRI